MKLYFVRHGKTDASIGDVVSYHDNPLNRIGFNQAQEVSEQLKSIPFDIIISSPSKRATQTAEVINAYHGLSIVTDQRWRERDLKAYLPLEIWNDSFDFDKVTADDIEPTDAFFKRVYDAINDLKRNYVQKTVLIAAHGGTHHALYAYANKLQLKGNMRLSPISYCECKMYEI